MRMIIAEEAQTRGKVRIGRHDITSNISPAFALLGYCPQFDAIWKVVTVREHLRAYAAIRGVDPKDINRYFYTSFLPWIEVACIALPVYVTIQLWLVALRDEWLE